MIKWNDLPRCKECNAVCMQNYNEYDRVQPPMFDRCRTCEFNHDNRGWDQTYTDGLVLSLQNELDWILQYE